MKRPAVVTCLSLLAWSSHALAVEPRVHVAAGGAHALGGPQSSEFGAGGAGTGTVELPATSRLGVQAGAGALVLSKGDAPKDSGLAPTGTGAAFMGTMGVRLRAFGATRVAGPWIDSNVGVVHTGDVTRPAFDAHLGWDIRVSQTSRIDVGPFVGYTQIFQPNAELRGDDARILTAGLSVSLGAKERARPAEPPSRERPLPQMAPPPPPVFVQEHEEVAEAVDLCKDGAPPTEDGCGDGVRIFEDRILLDDVVHFEFDSAKIHKKSHGLVRNIAHFIKDHEDIVDITIEGHADEVGSDEYNKKLSEARATSMKTLLVANGVEATRLRVVAHGKSQPKIVTLKREVENRRVELFVTRTREAGNVAASHGRSSR